MNIPATELAELLLRVARRLRAANATELEGLGVNPHQARALRVLAREAPVRPSSLAQHLHVAPRSATEVVDHLIASGWATRSPDPHDGRATLLEPTGEGRNLAALIDEARNRGAERVLGSLTPHERATLTRTLEPLAPPRSASGGRPEA